MSTVSAQEQALEMTLTPEKSVYSAGELPEFTVTLVNCSQQPVRYCLYKLDYRLKAAMVVDSTQKGPNFEAQPFVTQKWKPLVSEDIVFLKPGERITHRLSFQNDPIFGFLRRAKQPPVIPAANAIKGFPAGEYTFNTALSNQVGIYVGQDGVFDHKLEGRKVPDKWPGIPDCYLRLTEASATVRFD